MIRAVVCMVLVLLVACSGAAQAQCPALNSLGLVGHWKLDETSGTTAVDSAGSSDGTMQGGLDAGSDSTAGTVGNALSFDGVDDYIGLSATWSVASYNDFSIAFWYKSSIDASTDDQHVFADGAITGAQDRIMCGITDDVGHEDGVRLLLDTDTQSAVDLYNDTDVVDQQWHHIVCSRRSGDINIYVDGVGVNAGTYSYTITPQIAKTNIGDDPGNTEQVNGLLDDVRIYNRALSADNVKALYGCGAPPGSMKYDTSYNVMTYYNGAEWVAMGPVGGTPPTNGLVAHWKLDETSGSSIADSAGSHTGTWLDGDNDDVTEEAVSGMVNGALDFAGPNNYISIPDDPALNPAADWTISAWFKDPVSDQWIVAKVPSPQTHRDYWMEVEWDDKFQCAYTNNNTTIAAKDSSIFNGGGNWHLGTCVYDEGQQELRAYLDGVLVGTQPTGGTEPVDTSANLGIGDEATLAGGAQDGQIDDVRIYDRALSATEISQLYHFGLSGGLGDVSANCSNPSMPEGSIFYNIDYTVMQYCNGERWIGIGQ